VICGEGRRESPMSSGTRPPWLLGVAILDQIDSALLAASTASGWRTGHSTGISAERDGFPMEDNRGLHPELRCRERGVEHSGIKSYSPFSPHLQVLYSSQEIIDPGHNMYNMSFHCGRHILCFKVSA
jgi:hypothetical protein